MNKGLKKITSWFALNRFLLIVILGLYIATAHIFLPLFKKDEFYFLFSWRLFVFMPQKYVYDLTWDQGKTFLTRDRRKKLRDIGKSHVFFYLLNYENISWIKKDYKNQLLKLCQCQSIQFVTLKGSLTDHLIYKKPLEIVESIEL